MNKLLSIVLLGTALSLTACGGDSDSSGSSNNNEVIPTKFQGLPNCVIGNSSLINQDFFRINVSTDGSPTCLVKVPDLNNGRTFSLACRNDSINDETIFAYQIGGDSRDDLDSIGDDIQAFVDYLEDDSATTSDSKYGYQCD